MNNNSCKTIILTEILMTKFAVANLAISSRIIALSLIEKTPISEMIALNKRLKSTVTHISCVLKVTRLGLCNSLKNIRPQFSFCHYCQ